MMLAVYLLIISTIILWCLLKYNFSHWARKGFPYIKPNIAFGNFDLVCKGKRSFGTAIYDLYESSKEPFVGIYLLFRPGLLIRDAELAKDILTKDFVNFHDRGTYVSEKDQMSQNLFSLTGNKWKTLRSKLTPAFSSGKLKNMFETIEAVAQTMTNYLNYIVPTDKGTIIEIKDLTNRYAVDIIANVIFGLEVNSFAEPNNPFRTVTKKTNGKGFVAVLRSVAVFLYPGLFKILPIPATDPYVKKFLIDVVEKTISLRENTNYVRKDLMQLLLQLRNTGKLNLDDTMWDVETVAENLRSMPVEVLAAQLFLFHIAGTETSSLTITYCLYELTQNKDIMRKVIKDIDETLEKHNGKISYDCIQDMKYLELCVLETMRKYPGLPILNRECTKDYTIPGTKYTIEKGTPIIISLLGMQRDEKYFSDPLKFNPERYVEKEYNEAAYMPFGEGPRACIGIRLGKINVKVCLVMLLSQYEFEATEFKEIEFATHTAGINPKNDIKLMVTRRKKNINLK